jgi:hypothetical protein
VIWAFTCPSFCFRSLIKFHPLTRYFSSSNRASAILTYDTDVSAVWHWCICSVTLTYLQCDTHVSAVLETLLNVSVLSQWHTYCSLLKKTNIPSTREAEAGGFLSSRLTWSTKWVPGQPGLHRETLSRKTKTKPKQNKKTNQKPLRLLNIYLLFVCVGEPTKSESRAFGGQRPTQGCWFSPSAMKPNSPSMAPSAYTRRAIWLAHIHTHTHTHTHTNTKDFFYCHIEHLHQKHPELQWTKQTSRPYFKPIGLDFPWYGAQ